MPHRLVSPSFFLTHLLFDLKAVDFSRTLFTFSGTDVFQISKANSGLKNDTLALPYLWNA